MLGHELRNPLAAIHSGLQILRLPSTPPELRESTVDTVYSQTRHMARLVDDLLDVSRIMRGKVTIQLQDVTLQQIADEAAIARAAIDGRGCGLEIRMPDEPV